jgi:hypothetical protein
VSHAPAVDHWKGTDRGTGAHPIVPGFEELVRLDGRRSIEGRSASRTLLRRTAVVARPAAAPTRSAAPSVAMEKKLVMRLAVA